jgi:hypothetical protein
MFLLYGAQGNSVISNVFSGNYAEGLRLAGFGTSSNLVEGNFFGTDASGLHAVPGSQSGLTFYQEASSNTVGGLTASARNVLSGNSAYGLVISDTNTDGNVVEGNFIGLAADGVTALGNAWQGIIIENGAQGNIIDASNRIACNGYEGIIVYSNSTVGNTFRANNIFSNGEIGINLVGGTESFYGVTANHPGGAVPGPNDLQNYPVITNVFTSGANTIIEGTLNSTASRGFWIDCYRNTAPDPSGYGQGQFYAGSVSVTTDINGNAAFSLSTSGSFAGQYFSSTATDQTTKDTSEFSLDMVATNGPTPPSFVGPFSLTGAGFSANIAVTAGQSYHLQIATNLAAKPIAWTNLTNFVASGSNFDFTDSTATNSRARFYRVTSP